MVLTLVLWYEALVLMVLALLTSLVGRCAAELLRIFYFRKGGRPPSWIFIFLAIFVKNSNLRLYLSRLDPIPTCDIQPSSHVAVAKTALAERRAGKNVLQGGPRWNSLV